ncbi:hypothetical protein C8R47DRAFT_1063945 [Mycena vitilis]|nr:hypothetical protein C8R47DRAFT_1063945 [Mycena vitilis]
MHARLSGGDSDVSCYIEKNLNSRAGNTWTACPQSDLLPFQSAAWLQAALSSIDYGQRVCSHLPDNPPWSNRSGPSSHWCIFTGSCGAASSPCAPSCQALPRIFRNLKAHSKSAPLAAGTFMHGAPLYKTDRSTSRRSEQLARTGSSRMASTKQKNRRLKPIPSPSSDRDSYSSKETFSPALTMPDLFRIAHTRPDIWTKHRKAQAWGFGAGRAGHKPGILTANTTLCVGIRV